MSEENDNPRIVPMRLQKFLARAGAASRRGSENLMTAGRVTVNGEVVAPQMELGSTATEYEPYRDQGGGEIAPTTPLYGLAGAADTVEISTDGSVQATRRTAVKILDGTENFTAPSGWAKGAYYVSGVLNGVKTVDGYGVVANLCCTHAPAKAPASIVGTENSIGAGIGNGNNKSLYLNLGSQYPTAADFKAYLSAQHAAGTPVTVVYELASPQVETLEAVEPIAPQKGDNVFFTDADSLSATLYGSGWETVNDVDSQTQDVRSVANAALPKVDFQRVVRIDESGLHVGDNQINSGEVLIDSESVNVVMNGRKYSRFASNYVQFGNYQLRQSADGGLVFKLKE